MSQYTRVRALFPMLPREQSPGTQHTAVLPLTRFNGPSRSRAHCQWIAVHRQR